MRARVAGALLLALLMAGCAAPGTQPAPVVQAEPLAAPEAASRCVPDGDGIGGTGCARL